jgi:hypothetical protein
LRVHFQLAYRSWLVGSVLTSDDYLLDGQLVPRISYRSPGI